MARSVDLWTGKTDDTQAPPRVRLRVFERCNCLPEKNAADVTDKSKVAEIRKKHLGIRGPKRPWPKQSFRRDYTSNVRQINE